MPHGEAIYDEIAQTWFSSFSKVCESRDVGALLELILPDGWFRDLLTFTWDVRSRHGHEEIRAYLSNTFAEKELFNFTIDKRPGLQPSFFPGGGKAEFGVEFAFTFEMSLAWGRGFVRLLPVPHSQDKVNESSWKAQSVMMMIDDWKGHEEQSHESGIYDGHNLSWEEVQKQRREQIESDPQIVILGAGQAGLQQAARNRQLGVRTLIIEQDARVGDIWRKRYPTLALHTPRTHHNLLYQPFPSNWPVFTPKDKLAFWFEQYVEANDLIVWTSSTLASVPTFDRTSKRWNITINRDGKLITLQPPHLLTALGNIGRAYTPTIPGLEDFKGITLHASAFQGGTPFQGKNVIVVGACNTSHDVCQDLVFRGAASVTMIQRSSTCVISDKVLAERFSHVFPEGVPVEISDFKAALPFGLIREMMKEMQPIVEQFDKEMHDGLRKAGFHLNTGPDDSGQFPMVYGRGGGYFIDVGVAPLIINGKVKVKQGFELQKFTSTGVVFTDGAEMQADVVIFATGYSKAKDRIREILGDEIANRTKEIWGLDQEDEINGVYKLSGYPGLWFTAGDFSHSRFYSKQTALFIKAVEAGLTSFEELYKDEFL